MKKNRLPYILGVSVTLTLVFWAASEYLAPEDSALTTGFSGAPTDSSENSQASTTFTETSALVPISGSPESKAAQTTQADTEASNSGGKISELSIVSVSTQNLLNKPNSNNQSNFAQNYLPIQQELEFSSDKTSGFEITFDEDLPIVASIVVVGAVGQTIISATSINGVNTRIGDSPPSLSNKSLDDGLSASPADDEALSMSRASTLFKNDWIKADPPAGGRLKSIRLTGRSKIPSGSKVQVYLQILEDPQ